MQNSTHRIVASLILTASIALTIGPACVNTLPTREGASSNRRLSTYRTATLRITPGHPSLEKTSEHLRTKLCLSIQNLHFGTAPAFENFFCEKEEGRLGELTMTVQLDLSAATLHPKRPMYLRVSLDFSDTDSQEKLGNLVIEENPKEYPTEAALLDSITARAIRFLQRRH